MKEDPRKESDPHDPDRYVGGGPRGGQNWSAEGLGANQSYSAGAGYAEGPSCDARRHDPAPADDPTGATEPGAAAEHAVSPSDLGVQDYDLQGSYGKPAHGQQPRSDDATPPVKQRS